MDSNDAADLDPVVARPAPGAVPAVVRAAPVSEAGLVAQKLPAAGDPAGPLDRATVAQVVHRAPVLEERADLGVLPVAALAVLGVRAPGAVPVRAVERVRVVGTAVPPTAGV